MGNGSCELPRLRVNLTGGDKIADAAVLVHAALMAGGALVLAGCGLADSRSPVPEFMRAKASEPPPPEPPPDVRQWSTTS